LAQCPACGEQVEPNGSVCTKCGTPLQMRAPQALTGFSDKINDKAFKKYVKNSDLYSAVFSVVLAVAAVAGFSIYGWKSDEMDNPQAFYYGCIIGGMFLLIALAQIIRRRTRRDWDGVVIKKTAVNKTKKVSVGEDSYRRMRYTEYKVIFRDDRGRKHAFTVDNDDTRFNYYNVGERVRFHGRLGAYEKFDKSHDTFLFCAACSAMNPIERDTCEVCKCPLLK